MLSTMSYWLGVSWIRMNKQKYYSVFVFWSLYWQGSVATSSATSIQAPPNVEISLEWLPLEINPILSQGLWPLEVPWVWSECDNYWRVCLDTTNRLPLPPQQLPQCGTPQSLPRPPTQYQSICLPVPISLCLNPDQSGWNERGKVDLWWPLKILVLWTKSADKKIRILMLSVISLGLFGLELTISITFNNYVRLYIDKWVTSEVCTSVWRRGILKQTLHLK